MTDCSGLCLPEAPGAAARLSSSVPVHKTQSRAAMRCLHRAHFNLTEVPRYSRLLYSFSPEPLSSVPRPVSVPWPWLFSETLFSKALRVCYLRSILIQVHRASTLPSLGCLLVSSKPFLYPRHSPFPISTVPFFDC